jgi:hypothetical protein
MLRRVRLSLTLSDNSDDRAQVRMEENKLHLINVNVYTYSFKANETYFYNQQKEYSINSLSGLGVTAGSFVSPDA